MAGMAKMALCPTCGATLAANLVKLLKTDPEDYTCPGGSTDSRKDWEKQWGEDFVAAENKVQLELTQTAGYKLKAQKENI